MIHFFLRKKKVEQRCEIFGNLACQKEDGAMLWTVCVKSECASLNFHGYGHLCILDVSSSCLTHGAMNEGMAQTLPSTPVIYSRILEIQSGFTVYFQTTIYGLRLSYLLHWFQNRWHNPQLVVYNVRFTVLNRVAINNLFLGSSPFLLFVSSMVRFGLQYS